MNSLKKAISIAGGVYNTAEILNITPGAVSQWKQIPVKHVIPLEKAINGAVTRHELRPDIYPRD